jgi:alkylation response protein AidB-like acyl-CoA dehydrogenase
VLASLAIAQAGSEAQKARWLPGMASGEIVGTVALMESGVWRPEEWALPATPRLSGAKD